jgi:hypothetical protein
METQVRIWRVVPTSKAGSQAPTYFVETTDKDRSKAETSAQKQARQKSGLAKFNNWYFEVTKLNVRVDKYGRYIKHHQ